MAEVNITAKKRERIGKGSAGKYRSEGWIPAEYYSSHDDNQHLLLYSKDFETTLTHSHGLLNVAVEGEKKSLLCVVKDVQYEPIRGHVLHVDFQGVRMGEKITVNVPIILQGNSAGVKAGGILEHLIREAEVECLPKDIPERIVIDITALQIGDSVHVKDIEQENIKILDDPDETILLIEHPRIEKEVTAEEEAEVEEELTEPELIRERKEEEE